MMEYDEDTVRMRFSRSENCSSEVVYSSLWPSHSKDAIGKAIASDPNIHKQHPSMSDRRPIHLQTSSQLPHNMHLTGYSTVA